MICDVDPIKFWDYTLGELLAIIEAYTKKQKQKIIENYNLATMVAEFTGRLFSGKELPSIYDLYPDVEIAPEQAQNAQKQALEFYKDQFMMFANKHNAQRREN